MKGFSQLTTSYISKLIIISEMVAKGDGLVECCRRVSELKHSIVIGHTVGRTIHSLFHDPAE